MESCIRPLTVLVATVLAGVVSGCGGHAPARPYSATRVVPHIDARRIAAQCSGRLSYMPQWLPRAFAFSRWAVASRLAACDEGPIVHFTRGSIDLRWRASD